MAQSTKLQQVLNFRDVGKTVNQFLGQRRVREGVLYRSARPDEATPQDKAAIAHEFGIKTIIDLRTETELLKQAGKHQAAHHGPAESHDSATPAHASRISGIDYNEIAITSRPLEKHLLSQLTWWSFLSVPAAYALLPRAPYPNPGPRLSKVICFFILGYRIDAVRVIGQEVLLQRGLRGLGTDTLDHSGAEIRETLSLYARAPPTPILVHCTQGKDRTGLVCTLILMILDVPVSAIEHDYFLTDAALLSSRDERLAEVREIGLSDEWASTAEDMITGMDEHLVQKYGGLNAYLDHIGFGEAARTKLRDVLLY
ncbi:hypothetical protein DCS_06285 [Drechmeria coniospora]|uniref:Tyrosine specific protein phosphatases domain-containing protein n=1 Tax=Drechmeria coniospora TaxID=98403 RepID=A0A151GB49_DRECN|nr:hypothetical protein DCS_06285 [Drechmeria coniospora]KYK54328.1 hypothetical protein DCS_06285 [Drechmeria coniospora]